MANHNNIAGVECLSDVVGSEGLANDDASISDLNRHDETFRYRDIAPNLNGHDVLVVLHSAHRYYHTETCLLIDVLRACTGRSDAVFTLAQRT